MNYQKGWKDANKTKTDLAWSVANNYQARKQIVITLSEIDLAGQIRKDTLKGHMEDGEEIYLNSKLRVVREGDEIKVK